MQSLKVKIQLLLQCIRPALKESGAVPAVASHLFISSNPY
jgi:hypothetical protein